MASDNSAASSDQVAKLRAQIVLLKGQNTDLTTKNAQLGEELERTKYELRETQALLGQAVVNVARQSQSAGSPQLVYTLPEASSSRLKRPRSGSLDQADIPSRTLKKGKKQTHRKEEAGLSRSTRSSVLPRTPSTVKESPGKMVKFEVIPPTEVITIDDESDPPPDAELQVTPGPQAVVANGPRDPSKHAADDNSDLEDPNVSRELFDEFSNQVMAGEETPASVEAGQSDVEPARDLRKASASLRRSTRFLSTSSLTSLSASATPGPTTPDVKDEPEVDRKPKREPKQEDVFRLSSSVTAQYLHSVKPFAITPPPMTLEISRTSLRLAYGGSDQQFVQYIPAARNPGPAYTVNADGVKVPKDKRRVVFPMLHLNPSMPSTPGAPGLIFASRHEILYNPPWTLFCKRDSDEAVWLYLGEYECELVGKLTPAQFIKQSDVVKHRWAELIIKRRRQVCYMSMRARIALRAAGLFLNDSKEQEEELVNEEVERIKNGNGKEVTIDQILQAFSNGDEGVDIIRMTCVKYDHVFANDIMKRYPSRVAAAKQKQKRKPTHSASGSTSTSGQARRQKRSNVISSEDESKEQQEEAEHESDGVEERSKPSTNEKGKKAARSTPASKSKLKPSKRASTRSKPTVAPESSKSGSTRPRRRISARVVAVVDDMQDEGDFNDDADDSDHESGDAPQDDLSENGGVGLDGVQWA